MSGILSVNPGRSGMQPRADDGRPGYDNPREVTGRLEDGRRIGLAGTVVGAVLCRPVAASRWLLPLSS